jgi:pyrophosphatase PpaX
LNYLHRLRTEIYRKSYGTPANLEKQIYSHSVALARQAHDEGLRVAVATMSFSDEAKRVLSAIGLSNIVETVVGVDHVSNPKPAPDAFLLAIERLGVTPEETLVVEDSPRGTHAAAASGALWVCVATPFSVDALKAETELDAQWIVHDPSDLNETVSRRISSSG